jgi:hypothetical protein
VRSPPANVYIESNVYLERFLVRIGDRYIVSSWTTLSTYICVTVTQVSTGIASWLELCVLLT